MRILILLGLLLMAAFPVYAENDCLQQPEQSGCRAGLPEQEYTALLEAMEQHPFPEVERLPVDEQQIHRYVYYRLNAPAGVTLYGSPNGAVVGALDPGYHFITAYNREGDWIEINPGKWVLDDSSVYLVRPSQFTGIFLNEDQPYTMAWLLEDSYPAPYPGAEVNKESVALPRYTLVNIFAEVEVDDWHWYLIAPDHWVIQTEVARILFEEKPAEVTGRWVGVDLFEQVMVAYEEDTPVFATLIASGLDRFPTNEGLFQVETRIEDDAMSGAEGQSDFYRIENVLWAMYFDGKISLHGTYWHDLFGYRQSHGCVNLSISDAHWLYQWTEDQPDFWVHVYSSGVYRE